MTSLVHTAAGSATAHGAPVMENTPTASVDTNSRAVRDRVIPVFSGIVTLCLSVGTSVIHPACSVAPPGFLHICAAPSTRCHLTSPVVALGVGGRYLRGSWQTRHRTPRRVSAAAPLPERLGCRPQPRTRTA